MKIVRIWLGGEFLEIVNDLIIEKLDKPLEQAN